MARYPLTAASETPAGTWQAKIWRGPGRPAVSVQYEGSPAHFETEEDALTAADAEATGGTIKLTRKEG